MDAVSVPSYLFVSRFQRFGFYSNKMNVWHFAQERKPISKSKYEKTKLAYFPSTKDHFQTRNMIKITAISSPRCPESFWTKKQITITNWWRRYLNFKIPTWSLADDGMHEWGSMQRMVLVNIFQGELFDPIIKMLSIMHKRRDDWSVGRIKSGVT